MKSSAFKVLLYIFICMIINPSNSHAQEEWNWLLGGGGIDNDLIYAVTVGQNNIIYVAGGFRGQANIAGEELTSNGDQDIFLAAFDTLGNKIWLIQEGGINFEWANDIVTDQNHLYITGSFRTETVIGGNTLTGYNANTDDIFIAKYDLNGNYQWSTSAGGIQDDQGQGIALDDNSNIYITGPINHTAYFDKFTVAWAGFSDLFIAKYSSDGDCIWANGFGGPSYDYAFDIAVDHQNNLIVGGRFYETVQFGTYSLTSLHDADAFILKCTPDGNVTWVRQAGGQYHDHMTCVSVDSEDNYYVAGWYMGDISFENDKHVSAGGMDMFLAKYSTDGTYQWSSSFGNMEIDEATALSCSPDDMIFLAGEFQLVLDLGGIELTSLAYYDGFVACFNPDGSINWAEQLKSAGNINLRSGTVSPQGDYYAVGGFLDNIIAGSHQMNSIGSLDYYLARLGKADPGSVPQHDSENGIILFPVPVNETLFIRNPNINTIIESLTIFNLVGKMVISHQVSGTHPGSDLQIHVSHLTPGMYILEVKTNNAFANTLRKFIKQ